jgi:TPP-dependent pyruvate/acetoin dehydrogenase alpha subunit
MEDETRRDLYRMMVRIRTYEEAIRREYYEGKTPAFDIGAGQIPGEIHLAAGQEPVAAGVCARLTGDDAVTGPHRSHHVALAHGVDIRRMTAEIFGRETGLGRGKGGHMHLFDPAVHFGCSGIVAEGMPTAVGQALAFKKRGTRQVAVAIVGEGAVNQGAFHESVNLAALWRLPVVFVIEDNDWGISVPRTASTSATSASARGAAYGIPGERVEENSVEGVYEAAGRAVERARQGEGPSLVEVHTIRLWGHFEGDDEAYREIEGIADRDPIPTYEKKLVEEGLLDEERIRKFQQVASDEVEAAIAFAKESPEPEPREALEDVFA